MADTKAKVALLKELHKSQEALYEEKNTRYGDSFATTFKEYGPTVALIRLEDKLNRAKSLVKAGLDDSNGESLVDTLTDLSVYANMFLMELAGPQDFPSDKPKKKRDRSKRKEKEKAESKKNGDEAEPGPLDGLSKAELRKVIKELGTDVPRKASRVKMEEVINGFAMTDIAMAITAVKNQDGEDSEDNGDAE